MSISEEELYVNQIPELLAENASLRRQLAEAQTREWPPLNDDLRAILGKPNFVCAPIAHIFKAAGADIKPRSENEQAFVLHWLVGLYLKHGSKWMEGGEQEIRDAEERIRALSPPQSAASVLSQMETPAPQSGGSPVGDLIDMLLFCPACGKQHVDAPDGRTPDWKNPPHKSHLCHYCKTIWRPADVPTNGVAAIQTKGKADNWTVPLTELAATSPQPLDGVTEEISG